MKLLRTAALILGFFIAGPAIALLVLFAGCEGASPPLGNACGHNIPISLLGFSLVVWFVLAMSLTLARTIRNKE
jgi:hypothetical protein